jgi:hypothetical protein
MLEEKPKRKYIKKAKMLLRSNNDYIDHGYYQRILEEYKEREKRRDKKYDVILPDSINPKKRV